MSLPAASLVLSAQGRKASWRATREFFAYHGVWSFGVRAMRLWSLRMKMVLLVTVMALPLLPLMVSEIGERNRIATVNAQRIAGMGVANAAYALAIKLDRQRQALESGQPLAAGQAAAEQLALTERIAAALALGLPIDAAARSQAPVLERVADMTSASGNARLDLLQQARRALVNLRQVVLESSGALLSENPQMATQAALSLQHLPAMHRELSTLRGLATRQAALLEQTPRSMADLHAVLLAAAGSAADLGRVLQLAERAQGGLVGAEHDAAGHAFDAVRAALAMVRTGMLAPEPTVDLPALRREMALAAEGLAALQLNNSEALKTRLLALQVQAETQRQWLFGALAGTVLLAAYLIYSFFLVMRGGLSSLNHLMNRMAQGDLSARPTARGGDEVADTLHAMTISLARLSDLLATIRQGVGAITQASKQIADGNADLSDRSRRSADGLEQLVASVARYTEQLQTCSAQVESVVTTVQTLRLASVRNRRQVQRLQERMASLRGNSREIGQIVNLIDTIAFRTNILALNAQVEACKAGDAGRGFAVVAQEVRALATRSADSARKVSQIVTRSTLEIEQSGVLADETGQSIQESDAHVDAIHSAISSVAQLTQQGDRESALILDEIKVLKDSTAKNQALVEQLAVASDALRGQGERLSHKVGLFKLS